MIKIITNKIDPQELRECCAEHFETMVKFVVDIKSGKMAVGGEMHADGEALLIEQGALQADLWGGNFYPWHDPDERLEYTSFINIRPSEDHPYMEIEDKAIRRRVRELAESLLLDPAETLEPLS
ncbi:hypothetical protein GF407_04785 [candidate division KSB1 bacterium]|nr:hypothetical protein [candidate division KSB1 bacterium]